MSVRRFARWSLGLAAVGACAAAVVAMLSIEALEAVADWVDPEGREFP